MPTPVGFLRNQIALPATMGVSDSIRATGYLVGAPS
jgi:hypothetical protein